jgi:membrane protease YdiL (CAAX protease family)
VDAPPVPPTPPGAPSFLRLAGGFYAIVTLFALGFALFSENLSTLLGEKPLEWTGVAAAAGIALALVGLVRVGARAWTPMERAARAGAALLGPLTVPQALALALMSGVAEELLFRGALWPALGLWGTTLLFGLVHVLPRLELWIYPLFALVGGLALGLVRLGSGHVVPAMVAHVVVNALNLAWLGRLAARAAAAPPAPPTPPQAAPPPATPPADPAGPPA